MLQTNQTVVVFTAHKQDAYFSAHFQFTNTEWKTFEANAHILRSAFDGTHY